MDAFLCLLLSADNHSLFSPFCWITTADLYELLDRGAEGGANARVTFKGRATCNSLFVR